MTYRLGKWSKTGVPHRGWTCVDEVDLFEQAREENPGEWVEIDDIAQECEMCETAEVTVIHNMEHPDYDEQLDVCSGCRRAMER